MRDDHLLDHLLLLFKSWSYFNGAAKVESYRIGLGNSVFGRVIDPAKRCGADSYEKTTGWSKEKLEKEAGEETEKEPVRMITHSADGVERPR